MTNQEVELIKMGSEALKKAALNEEAKNYLLSNEKLFHVLKKAARRYIGGDTFDEALPVIKTQNTIGHKCSVDFMGESVANERAANEATDEFIELSNGIHKNNLDCTISLDLSHIGLTVDKELAKRNILKICEAASLSNKEVMISAEGIDRTDSVLDVYKYASSKGNNIGITVQAYLHRTKDDLHDLMKQPGKIRMVKGAFATSKGHSMERGPELDQTYLAYTKKLIGSGHQCSIASHDPNIQNELAQFVANTKADKGKYEFENLMGIKEDMLNLLKDQGHATRIYVVYGREWYLYLCNRLAEYPLNLFRLVNDIVE